MRQIKFRGFQLYENKWVYGGVHIADDEALILEQRKGNDCFHSPVNPTTIGQFTGLHDKNGVEIYEGDICKRKLDEAKRIPGSENWCDYWLIEWLGPTAGFTTTCIADYSPSHQKMVHRPKRTNSFSQRFKEMGEVIGNIYENPELLK